MLENFWEQQLALLNTLLSRKVKRGADMVSLTEDDITLIPEVIKLMSPLKVATILLSEGKKKSHHLSDRPNTGQIAEAFPVR